MLTNYIARALPGGGADDGMIQRSDSSFGRINRPTGAMLIDFPNSEASSTAVQVFLGLASLDACRIGASTDRMHAFLTFDGNAATDFIGWFGDLVTPPPQWRTAPRT